MASVSGNIFSFLAQSSILFIEIWMNVTYLNLEEDSACNLVKLFLDYIYGDKNKYSISNENGVRIKKIYVSIN